MARYLHSIALPATAILTGASITPFDLPVNPLSLLLLRFEVTRTAPAALLTYEAIDDLITAITSVRVLHKGEQIIAGSLRDLMLVNAVLQRAFPGASKLHPVGAAVDSIVFPLCLGRRAYDPVSCFPATARGNLRMEMDTAAFPAQYTALRLSVEAVELIDAQPSEHVKYTTQARTAVVGQFDAPLPIRNAILGILLFDTAIATLNTDVSSWGTVKLLKDNVEQYHPQSDFVTLAGMFPMQMLSQFVLEAGHVHKFVAADALSSMTDSAAGLISTGHRGYAYLDYDPLRDGSYQLETAGASDLAIRSVGASATAIRYLPIERVPVK
ncbi:MAG TPA: hypothetical protein VIH11_06300 [Gemmatimonadaceae bacterium]